MPDHHAAPNTDPSPANLPTDRRALLAGLGGIAAGAFIASKANAGPLNPPAGPIESTGKTLRDVEPRIAINSTNTPGDTDSVFRISASGSYYLTGNVTASTGKAAIEIAASNVTIDLSGYSITTLSNLAAIRLSLSGRTNISVRNGHIGPAGTGGGIDLTPLLGTQTVGGSIENVHVTGTEGTGIQVGDGVVLIGCTASNNTKIGFQVGKGCVISSCAALDNGEDGFRTGDGCVVSDGVAAENGFRGVVTSEGCTVSRCVVKSNREGGILCTYSCLIRDNSCHQNGVAGNNGAGIEATLQQNRIEGNQCVDGSRGIAVNFSRNFIARNTCVNNTTNWSVVPENICFVVQATAAGGILGNSGGVSPGSTNPNANYTY
jgi:parallel beta-helix repeat protein